MKIPFKNSTRLIVTYLITIAIFLVLFKHIPISNVISGLKNTNPILISFALVISFLSNIIITSLRYKLIIKHLGKNLSLFESMQIKGGCSVFKTLLPARAGEFISMEYLKRNGDFAYSDSFFAIVAEYILNVLALIIFILLGIVLFCLGLNCQLAQNFSRRATFFVLSLNHPIHENKDNLINKLSQNFKKYYIKFKELCGYRSIIICTILCMGAEVINFYLLSRALNVPIPLNTVLRLVPLSLLISSLPITLGGLGIRECTILFLFKSYASAESLLAVGVLYSFVENIFPLLINCSFTGFFIKNMFRGKIS